MAATTKVKAAGAVTLVLETAVADFAKSVQKHGPGQRVLGLALVQADLHTAAQIDILHPVEREQCALDATQFAQCNSPGRSGADSCRACAASVRL